MKHQKKRNYWIILSTALFLSVLFGILIGGGQGTSAANQEVYPKVKEDNPGSNRFAQLEPFWDSLNNDTLWDLDSIEQLAVGAYMDEEGMEASELIKAKGKGTNVAYDYNDLTLTWKTEASSIVEAFFENRQGQHFLRRLSGDTVALQEAADWDLESNMPASYFEQLVVGKSDTGVGGVSYRDVLKQYGKAYFSLRKDSDTGLKKLELTYTGEQYATYRLSFLQQGEDSFLLAEKKKY